MSGMAYRGYHARVEFSAEDGVFAGRIAGIQDVITFEGESVQKLRAAFEEAVDDYISTCSEIGKDPQNLIVAKSCFAFLQRFTPALPLQQSCKV